MLDKEYPTGTKIRFQKDADDEAEYYTIDLLDAELVDSPLKMPENALSIEEFGAIANDGADDSLAINNCILEAHKQRKDVWLPVGVFDVTNPVLVNGIDNIKAVNGLEYYQLAVPFADECGIYYQGDTCIITSKDHY